MSVLPDILKPNLNVVFCGTAVSDESAALGHYYSKPSNSFWQLLTLGRLHTSAISSG